MNKKTPYNIMGINFLRVFIAFVYLFSSLQARLLLANPSAYLDDKWRMDQPVPSGSYVGSNGTIVIRNPNNPSQAADSGIKIIDGGAGLIGQSGSMTGVDETNFAPGSWWMQDVKTNENGKYSAKVCYSLFNFFDIEENCIETSEDNPATDVSIGVLTEIDLLIAVREFTPSFDGKYDEDIDIMKGVFGSPDSGIHLFISGAAGAAIGAAFFGPIGALIASGIAMAIAAGLVEREKYLAMKDGYVFPLYGTECPYLNDSGFSSKSQKIERCIPSNKLKSKYSFQSENCYLAKEEARRNCPSETLCLCKTVDGNTPPSTKLYSTEESADAASESFSDFSPKVLDCDKSYQPTSTKAVQKSTLSCFVCNSASRMIFDNCMSGAKSEHANLIKQAVKNYPWMRGVVDRFVGSGIYVCIYARNKLARGGLYRIGCVRQPRKIGPPSYPRILKNTSIYYPLDYNKAKGTIGSVVPFRNTSQSDDPYCNNGAPELGESARGTFFFPKIKIKYGPSIFELEFKGNRSTEPENVYGGTNVISGERITKSPWSSDTPVKLPFYSHQASNKCIPGTLDNSGVAHICLRIEYNHDSSKGFLSAYQAKSDDPNLGLTCSQLEASNSLKFIGSTERPPLKYKYNSNGLPIMPIAIDKEDLKSEKIRALSPWKINSYSYKDETKTTTTTTTKYIWWDGTIISYQEAWNLSLMFRQGVARFPITITKTTTKTEKRQAFFSMTNLNLDNDKKTQHTITVDPSIMPVTTKVTEHQNIKPMSAVVRSKIINQSGKSIYASESDNCAMLFGHKFCTKRDDCAILMDLTSNLTEDQLTKFISPLYTCQSSSCSTYRALRQICLKRFCPHSNNINNDQLKKALKYSDSDKDKVCFGDEIYDETCISSGISVPHHEYRVTPSDMYGETGSPKFDYMARTSLSSGAGRPVLLFDNTPFKKFYIKNYIPKMLYSEPDSCLIFLIKHTGTHLKNLKQVLIDIDASIQQPSFSEYVTLDRPIQSFASEAELANVLKTIIKDAKNRSLDCSFSKNKWSTSNDYSVYKNNKNYMLDAMLAAASQTILLIKETHLRADKNTNPQTTSESSDYLNNLFPKVKRVHDHPTELLESVKNKSDSSFQALSRIITSGQCTSSSNPQPLYLKYPETKCTSDDCLGSRVTLTRKTLKELGLCTSSGMQGSVTFETKSPMDESVPFSPDKVPKFIDDDNTTSGVCPFPAGLIRKTWLTSPWTPSKI